MSLSAREAKLRADATRHILAARCRIDGGSYRGAFWHTIYNHPRAALRAISQAEAHLEQAKRALAAWGGRRG